MKKIISFLTGVIIAATCSFNVFAADNLIAPQRSELLRTASSFSVFVENDFGANGSDCEGRIACGGGANLGEMEFYSTNSSEYASVIVSRGPLQQFDSNNKIFVVGTKVKDSDIKVNGTVYKKDLIDFSTEFNYLRNTSLSLAAKENGTVNIENSWCKYITFSGTDNYNYFTVDSSIFNTDKCFVDFQVPKNSYSIVNIIGDSVDLNTQLYGMSYAGKRVNGNNSELNNHILYNLPNTQKFTLGGTGTFYGSILAPFADGTDSMTGGAHVAGELIAKSYFGGIEFGGIGFTGGKDKEPVTSTTTNQTTTAMTTSTTSTSTTISTSTSTISTTVTSSSTATTPNTTATTITTSTVPTTTITNTTTTSTTSINTTTTTSNTILTTLTSITEESTTLTKPTTTESSSILETLTTMSTTYKTSTKKISSTTNKTTSEQKNTTKTTVININSTPKTSDFNLTPILLVGIVAAASVGLMKKKK